MKTLTTSAIALALGAGAAFAGALDRTGQDLDIIFEDGNRAELSFGRVAPEVSGIQTAPVGPVPPGGASGNMSEAFGVLGIGLKMQFTDRLSASIIYDEPFGADVNYPQGQPYFASGSTATFESKSVTGVLRFNATERVSVHGGLRWQKTSAQAFVPYVRAPAGPTAGIPYAVTGSEDQSVGYLVGAAFEIPDIALRASLTYNSAIEHDLDTVESGPVPGTSTTTIETPQSVNLAFQTGVAEDTLVFGSIRWTDWSSFQIRPRGFALATGASLVSYTDDIWTYEVGVGRRFTDTFSGAVSLTYEPQAQQFASNLGPTDGRVALTVGGTLDMGHGVETTAGVTYIKFLDTETALFGNGVSSFQDNDAVGFGISVGYSF